MAWGALGDGQALWGIVNRRYIVSFVDATIEYGNQCQVDEILNLLQDRDKARAIGIAISLSQFPDAGARNREEFNEWSRQHRKDWDEFWRDQP